MKKLFSYNSIIFLVIFLLLLYFGRSGFFKDPGTFWHTVLGQYILSNHIVPAQDNFSFTFHGYPWVDSQWLMECFMAIIFNFGGFDGLLIITCTSLAFLFTWLLNRYKKAGFNSLMAVLMVAMTLGASTLHFHVRPHLVTIFFMAIMFNWLIDFEKQKVGIIKLFWLIPIFIVWTNSHGGVLGGLGTLILILLGWSLTGLIYGAAPINNFPTALKIYGLLLACGLTILINPYGLALPKTWLAIMQSPVIAAKINEHLPLWKMQGVLIVTVFGIFYLISFLGTFPKIPRITWFIPIIWFVLTLFRVRHAPLFAVTAGIALVDIFPQTRWRQWLVARGWMTFQINPKPVQGFFGTPISLVIPLLLICSLLGLAGFTKNTGLDPGRGLVKLSPHIWPVACLPELTEYAASHSESPRIFNEMYFGGFLIFFVPKLQIFIDDRCELYGDDFLLEALDAPGQRIEFWSQKYGFDLALTVTNSNYYKYLKSAADWQLIKETLSGSLFKKLSPHCK